MTALSSLPTLSDRELLSQLELAVQQEWWTSAQIVALLMEVDARKLYAAQGCSSLFTYCVQILHFSEHAAYLRIEAARAARRFPAILDRLSDGSLHLSAISLLAPHLTMANHAEVLTSARHKSKRDVEQLVARLRPQPDVPAVVRRIPQLQPTIVSHVASPPAAQTSDGFGFATPLPVSAVRRAEIKPLSPDRFKVQFTVSVGTYEKLRQVQNLLRHSITDGNPAAIFDRALTLLLKEVSRTKHAATGRPRTGTEAKHGSRHVPAVVKREVWRRDRGQCAFRGERGRCQETGFLEFHHVVPYAIGGPTTTANLELRCHAHNAYEAEQRFGLRPSVPLVRESDEEYLD